MMKMDRLNVKRDLVMILWFIVDCYEVIYCVFYLLSNKVIVI